MPPPVMRDHAIAPLAEEEHLPVPVVRGKWPAVRENDRLTRSPIFVINLRAILGCDRCHTSSFVASSLRTQSDLTFANVLHAADTRSNLPPLRSGCRIGFRIDDLRSVNSAWNSPLGAAPRNLSHLTNEDNPMARFPGAVKC